MKHYLVTGVAGSGKSTICDKLTSSGYDAYDLDKGFTQWVNRSTGEPAKDLGSEPMILNHDWNIKQLELKSAIDKSKSPSFFCGSAHDLYEYTDSFDGVFLLKYPSQESLEYRINHRTNSDYGQSPGELEQILDYWQIYESRFLKSGATAIDCTLPPGIVIGKILELALI